MTLLEAIRSGRPIRRKGWGHWYKRRGCEHNDIYYRDDGSFDVALNVSPKIVIAEDWEIQEPTVTITRSQFWEAFESVAEDWEGQHFTISKNLALILARKLGLEAP